MKTILKPWGKEVIIEQNKKYVLKKLCMNKGHRCSLQYHEYKHETIFVLEGKLKITVGPSIEKLIDNIYMPYESISLLPKEIHRMEALEDSVYLEASTPELDDVIRLIDDYSRKS